MAIALAAIAGVIAGLAVSWAFVVPDGPAWAAGIAVVIILVIGGLRGFEAAIAAAIGHGVRAARNRRSTGDGRRPS